MNGILSIFWHGVTAHRLPPEFDSHDVSTPVFKGQIEWLLGRYAPISVWEFLAILDGERRVDSYAKPPVLLGFDDGFRGVIDNALPILQRLGVPAVFFVVGEILRSPNFLPWFVEMKHLVRVAKHKRVTYRGVSLDLTAASGRAEAYRLTRTALRASKSPVDRDAVLAELAKVADARRPTAQDVDEDLRFVSKSDLTQLGESSILTVASHAMTHRHLADLSEAEQAVELHQSDVILGEHTAPYCPVVAYPAGSFNATTVAIAKDIYRAGFGVLAGVSYRNRWAYPRLSLGTTVAEASYALSSRRLNFVLPLKRWLHSTGLRTVGA